MVEDVLLLVGCIFIAFGVVRSLVLMSDRISPLSGLFYTLLGGGIVYYVYKQKDGELSLSEVPQALFRVIGNLI